MGYFIVEFDESRVADTTFFKFIHSWAQEEYFYDFRSQTVDMKRYVSSVWALGVYHLIIGFEFHLW